MGRKYFACISVIMGSSSIISYRLHATAATASLSLLTLFDLDIAHPFQLISWRYLLYLDD